MNLNLVLLVLFLIIPIIVYHDYKAGHDKCEHNSELFLASIPLLSFFYSTQFLYALCLLMLLVLYGIALKIVAHKYRWLKFNLQLMRSYSIGSLGCGVLGYGLYKLVAYLWSLISTIDLSPLTKPEVWFNKANDVGNTLGHWPYMVYGVIIIVIVLATLFDRMPARENKGEFSVFFVLFLIPASLILPWFSEHYWWLLLSTFFLLPLVVFFVYGYEEEDKNEAISITRVFFYAYFILSHFNILFYWLFS